MRCQWGLQSPNSLEHKRVSAHCCGWLCQGAEGGQKEGTTHRGRNTLQFCVASMFILIAGEQCYSTPPTAWACGLVAQSVPTHAIWLACFLLFFNIDFTMKNLTVSLPVLEWHLHVAFTVAFCNFKIVFLSPMTLASLEGNCRGVFGALSYYLRQEAAYFASSDSPTLK